GARRATIPARVMRVLTQVGLAAKAQAYPRELSGGEQQRVAIARALVNEPTVLLADEPTGNLDERATRGVFQLLRDINASGTAVVMATHDLDLVRQAPYRVIELQEGAVVYDSAVDDPRRPSCPRARRSPAPRRSWSSFGTSCGSWSTTPCPPPSRSSSSPPFATPSM